MRAICEHSVPLRIGALNDRLRGVLHELDRALGEMEAETALGAQTLETNSVASLLNLLGYPPRDDPARRAAFVDGDRDLLDADAGGSSLFRQADKRADPNSGGGILAGNPGEPK